MDYTTEPPLFRLYTPPTQLHYHPSFLLPVFDVNEDFEPPFPIDPPSPPHFSPPATFERTSFHCQVCGRISSSRLWTGWECLTCHFKVRWHRPVVDVPTAWNSKVQPAGFLGKPDPSHIPRIETRTLEDGRSETHYLFASGCSLIHRRAPRDHPLLGFADDTFRKLQTQGSLGENRGGIGFERRVLKQSPLGKGTVTSHYSVNFGGLLSLVGRIDAFSIDLLQLSLLFFRGLWTFTFHARKTLPRINISCS